MNDKPYILFGGTFDPIHNGHMAIAEKLYKVFNTPITFLPTGVPPYKKKSEITTKDRIRMLQLALNNSNKFDINTIEIEQNNFCYTYRTLSQIRKKLNNKSSIFFIIGGDSLTTLNTWDNWHSLFELTNFVIIKRNGYNNNNIVSELSIELNKRLTNNFQEFKTSIYGKCYFLDFQPFDISSTIIRYNIKNNLPIKDYVPANVADYIIQHNLYK